MADGTRGNRRAATPSSAPPRSDGAIGPRVRALVVLLLVVAGLLVAAAAASAQSLRPSAQPRWILFTAHAPGAAIEQIFRIAPSGKELKQLTRGASPASAPAFSPDGKRIAFARLGAGIFSMNPDGTGLRPLTTNGRDSFPAWSPDGKQLAFLRPAASGWRVYVMLASGGEERLLRLAPPAGRPSWTTRGLLIPTEGDVARIDVQTGRVQKYLGAFIDAFVGAAATSVSPDLGAVAFVGARRADPGDKDCGEGFACPRYALFTQDISKQAEPRLLVKDAGPASFSADSKSIVFVARNRIVVWRLADGTSTTIRTGKLSPTTSAPPAWQPR